MAIEEATGSIESVSFQFNGIEAIATEFTNPAVLADDIHRRMQQRNAQISQPILTDEVLSAHRLPLPIKSMVRICKHAPKGSHVGQRGEWIVVTKPIDQIELP